MSKAELVALIMEMIPGEAAPGYRLSDETEQAATTFRWTFDRAPTDTPHLSSAITAKNAAPYWSSFAFPTPGTLAIAA